MAYRKKTPEIAFFGGGNNGVYYHPSGCGSVLNAKGEVEMDAIVMDGRTLASGAVSAVRNIANPVQLARLVMDKVQHVLAPYNTVIRILNHNNNNNISYLKVSRTQEEI